MVTVPGRWRESGWHGGHERALQWQEQFRCPVCVNPACWFSLGTITLCQANTGIYPVYYPTVWQPTPDV